MTETSEAYTASTIIQDVMYALTIPYLRSWTKSLGIFHNYQSKIELLYSVSWDDESYFYQNQSHILRYFFLQKMATLLGTNNSEHAPIDSLFKNPLYQHLLAQIAFREEFRLRPTGKGNTGLKTTKFFSPKDSGTDFLFTNNNSIVFAIRLSNNPHPLFLSAQQDYLRIGKGYMPLITVDISNVCIMYNPQNLRIQDYHINNRIAEGLLSWLNSRTKVMYPRISKLLEAIKIILPDNKDVFTHIKGEIMKKKIYMMTKN